jgi:hypothetical protein
MRVSLMEKLIDKIIWPFEHTIMRFVAEHPYMTIAVIALVNFFVTIGKEF